jgi:hypothetical protein
MSTKQSISGLSGIYKADTLFERPGLRLAIKA